jgi:hypothetical protein
MVDGHTEASMFAQVVITLYWLAVILAGCTCGEGLFSRLALEALALTAERLEMIKRARGTRGQACRTVVAR